MNKIDNRENTENDAEMDRRGKRIKGKPKEQQMDSMRKCTAGRKTDSRRNSRQRRMEKQKFIYVD